MYWWFWGCAYFSLLEPFLWLALMLGCVAAVSILFHQNGSEPLALAEQWPRVLQTQFMWQFTFNVLLDFGPDPMICLTKSTKWMGPIKSLGRMDQMHLLEWPRGALLIWFHRLDSHISARWGDEECGSRIRHSSPPYIIGFVIIGHTLGYIIGYMIGYAHEYITG